jgi:hypothetical protein
MPARHFTKASSEYVSLALGAVPVFGPATVVALLRKASDSGGNQVVFQAGDGADPDIWLFYINGAGNNGMRLFTGVTDIGDNGANYEIASSEGWALIGFTKATGSVTARVHKYVYSTNAVTHAATTTAANSGTPLSNNGIGSFNTGSGDYFDGDIAAVGVWNVAMTDGQFEALPFSLKAWYAPATPKGLWLLDQDAVAQKIVDLTGGGANENGRSGTTVGTGSVPVFTYGAPVIVRTRQTSGGVTTHFGAAATTLTFSSTTVGTRKRFGAAVTPLVFSATDVGRVTAKSSATLTETFGAVTAGKRTRLGAATLTETFTATTTGTRTRFGAAAATFTFNATTTGRPGEEGTLELGLTFNATTAGARTTRSAASLTETFTASTSGEVEGRVTGAASLTETFTATTGPGKLTAKSSLSLTETITRVTVGRLTAKALAALTETFHATTSGRLASSGAASLTLTFHATTEPFEGVLLLDEIRGGGIVGATVGRIETPTTGVIG